MMDITRNQYFFAGLLLLLVGIQLRLVDSADLTPEFTQFLAERTGHPVAAVNNVGQSLTPIGKADGPEDHSPARVARLVADFDRQRVDPAQLRDEETGQLSRSTCWAGHAIYAARHGPLQASRLLSRDLGPIFAVWPKIDAGDASSTGLDAHRT